MDHEYDQERKRSQAANTGHHEAVEPGQSTRSHRLRKPEQPIASGLVQRKAGAGGDEAAVHEAAARGVMTPSSPLPHADTIQRAFGRHDISGVQAHIGSEAAASAREMGAAAFATGNHVVLGGGTDLHTVAHEATHVVQQRGGVELSGGVGGVGDPYEAHADEVADTVVQGRSAEDLLDAMAPSPRGSDGRGPIQMQSAGGSSSKAGNVVQRMLLCCAVNNISDFHINTQRPAWDGFTNTNAIPRSNGQQLCHLIPFDTIQNDLWFILHTILDKRGAVGPQQLKPLIDFCNSLFTTSGPQDTIMRANLNRLISSMSALPALAARPLNQQEHNDLEGHSNALLVDLNSCLDNLRLGDGSRNQSIQQNLDAEFAPGTIWYQGPIQINGNGAAPAPAVRPVGANLIVGPQGGGVVVGPFEAVCLTPAHEVKVYAYRQAANMDLSFVLHAGGGVIFGTGTPAGTQLPSTQMPTVPNMPVIVRDPNNNAAPWLFV